MVHLEAGQSGLVLPYGEYIQQRLCGVLMTAVAGVDDVATHYVGEKARGSGGRMAYHYRVGRHGSQVSRRVGQGFPLGHARTRARYVYRIGGQSLGRDLKRNSRARAVLEEQVDHRLAPERGHFFDVAFADFGERLRRVEQERNVLGR